MKEHPILFSTPMVQAILEGQKTMTRRTVKGHPLKWLIDGFTPQFTTDANWCPYGKPGDILWVRETMAFNKNSQTYWPVADGYGTNSKNWTDYEKIYQKIVPSIHVPKTASRIWLKVKSVHVEQLNAICVDDIIFEGIRIPVNARGNLLIEVGLKDGPAGFLPKDKALISDDYLIAYWKSLWCRINGRESLEANPWVWVVEFEVLSTTGKPADL